MLRSDLELGHPLGARDVEPAVDVSGRLLDHHQRAGGLEGALQHQLRGLARCVALLVGDDGEEPLLRPLPGDGPGAAGVQVGGESLDPPQLVAPRQLDHVDAGVLDGEGDRDGVLRGPDCPLGDLHVLLLGDVLRLAGGEGGLAELAVPDAPVEPDDHLLPLHALVVGPHRDDPRDHLARLLEVTLELHPQHERRERPDLVGCAHLLVVRSGDGRLEAVGARRAVDVERRIHLHRVRALRVQHGVAPDCRGRTGRAGARELGAGGEEEALAPLGDVQRRTLRHVPPDLLTRRGAAGVVAGDRLDRDWRVQRRDGRP